MSMIESEKISSNYPSSKSNANRNLWASFLVGVHFKAQTSVTIYVTIYDRISYLRVKLYFLEKVQLISTTELLFQQSLPVYY